MHTARAHRLVPFALPACVALGTFFVWWAVRAGPYRLDDFATPLDDPASASLGAFVANLGRTLRPLTKLSYALEASLGVTEAGVRRAVSAAIHAAGAGALAVFLGKGGVRPLVAGLLALAWSLHPVHAESVLSVAGRSATVGASFVLLSLALLAVERPRSAGVAMALAVLGREAAAGGFLGVGTFALTRRPASGSALERVGPALLGCLGAVAWSALRPRARVLAEFSFLGRPVGTSIVQQISAVPVGVSLYPRPWALSCDHGEALPASAASWLFVLGALLFVGAAAAAFALRRRQPLIAVGLMLWLGALLPTQSFFPKLDPLTERPLGLAFAGIVIALAPLFEALASRARAVVVTLLVAAVLLSTRATLGRGALYASDVALWSDAAQKSVSNPRPFVELALALDREGRRREAIVALRRANVLDPFSSSVQARLRLWEQSEHPQENPR